MGTLEEYFYVFVSFLWMLAFTLIKLMAYRYCCSSVCWL